ncbi:MgtC/SapB family protein [Schaalia naturae]|uniref:MgtC/SapB family protein n=1 Tax=Schaalia naturae TaxID=635203 RepID=A0ABW2SIR0_9ACTO
MNQVPLESMLAFVARLGLALFLCGAIGLERQYHQKDAGVRTHALVGMGAALFTVVGVASSGSSAVDTTRVAAQVVSGIGFLGAGVIFVDRDAVRGLTTAGAIWLSAAVGTACGSGEALVALAATALYLVLVGIGSPLLSRLPTNGHRVVATITYLDRKGALREVMALASAGDARVQLLSSEVVSDHGRRVVRIQMQFEAAALSSLLSEIADLHYVLAVETGGHDRPEEC